MCYGKDFRGEDFQRFLAALRAMDLRFAGESLAARALPPFSPPRLPSSTAAGFFSWVTRATSDAAI